MAEAREIETMLKKWKSPRKARHDWSPSDVCGPGANTGSSSADFVWPDYLYKRNPFFRGDTVKKVASAQKSFERMILDVHRMFFLKTGRQKDNILSLGREWIVRRIRVLD